MADTKITALTALTGADPANDVIPIVDVSDTTMAASGTTKKISVNNILGASGTATLASATITGDLTVDTNVLKVDTLNNRVGIVNASPAYPLDVNGAIQTTSGSAAGLFQWAYGASASSRSWRAWNDVSANGDFQISTSTTRTGSTYSDRYRIDVSGVHEWSNTSGLAMTLNSTGLGLGQSSPFSKLHIQGTSQAGCSMTMLYTGLQTAAIGIKSNGSLTLGLDGGTGTTDRLLIDTSGNCGIGVQPSAWGSPFKALQVSRAALRGSTATTGLSFNTYSDGTNLRYIAAGLTALDYYQNSGSHVWQIAGVGANAGDPITFTQAMTLDASGNLLLGTTSSPLASRVSVGVTNGQPDAFVIRNSAATAGLYWRLAYVNSSNTFHILNQGGVGVYLTDGATSWTGTSDERLKDIIEPISNAVAKVGSLRSVIGKFKTDSEGTRRSFLIAQDVQSVLPEAVDTTNADAFGVRYSEVIPLLVAAIKELTARVQTLETR